MTADPFAAFNTGTARAVYANRHEAANPRPDTGRHVTGSCDDCGTDVAPRRLYCDECRDERKAAAKRLSAERRASA